jgi:uncharacterized protein (TIGR03437 family)
MFIRACSTALILIAAAAFSAPAQTTVPTFNKEIVRIFQANCQSCHHPGDIGSFSMMDYAGTRPWARSIKEQVLLKQMPPWKPSQGADVFKGARVLSQADIDTITAWVDGGAPEGDPADLPPPLKFDGAWALGEPDLVIGMSAPFAVPDSGSDIYRCFSLPTNLPADTYVSAFQVAPGDGTVVHHVVMYSDPTGISKRLETVPGQGYPCFGDPGFNADPSFLAAWAPGVRPSFMNVGTAMRIPRNGYMAMQVHYHLNGTATSDQTQVGIYFARWPVDKLVSSILLLNTNFRIPAGNPHYLVNGSSGIPIGAHLVNILPHMHLLGRESHVSMTGPDGATSPLIDINDWDFNWQGFYDYVQPVAVLPGSKIQFSKYYDNSANNPRNPNSPPVAVGWGEQTTDEMAVVYFGYTLDLQHLIAPTFSTENIVNSASLTAGAAPGALLSLYGIGLGSNWQTAAGGAPSLARAAIQVGAASVPVPLFYASPAEVHFQMPFEASGATTLTFTREDGSATTVNVNVAAAQPGLFTVNASGAGLANARLADASVLSESNPVNRGDVVTLYATGLGAVTPAVATGAAGDGTAACANTVQVTVGDRVLSPDLAVLAAGAVGVYQINVRIPADLTAMGDVPVKLTVAGLDSNTVAIAIR